MEGFTEAETMF